MVEREGKFSTMAEMAAGSYAVAVLEAVLQWGQQHLCVERGTGKNEKGILWVRGLGSVRKFA